MKHPELVVKDPSQITVDKILLLLYKRLDAKTWTQGMWARNKRGQETGTDGTDATCWCLLGACRKLQADFMRANQGAEYHTTKMEIIRLCRQAEQKLHDAAMKIGFKSAFAYNDNQRCTIKNVRALVARAIKDVKGIK